MNETYLETQNVSLPPAPKQGPRVANIAAILLGLFSLLMLCVAAGLGYWAYTLNTDLKASQAEVASWKSKHEALTTEKNKLTTDLNSTRSELDANKAALESTKAELETAKADLESARSDMAAMQEKIDKALKYLNVLDGLWGETWAEVEVKVKATGDSSLLSTFRVWETSRDFDDHITFFDEVVAAIIDILQ